MTLTESDNIEEQSKFLSFVRDSHLTFVAVRYLTAPVWTSLFAIVHLLLLLR